MKTKEYQTILDELSLESKKTYTIEGIIYSSDYPFEKIYTVSLIDNYKEKMTKTEKEKVNVLVAKIEENVLVTFKNALNYVNKFLYTEDFVNSFEFKNICKLISKISCFDENINKLSNSSEIHKIADKILELFKRNLNTIRKNIIYAELLFKDIIKVSSDPNQISPLNAVSMDYEIVEHGAKWKIKMYGNEIEITNNKDIRYSINKNNILFFNVSSFLSSNGLYTFYYVYFVFKLSDSTFTVFDTGMITEECEKDIISWAVKNDVKINHNNWEGKHPLKSGFNGLTYVDYFKYGKNDKKTKVSMIVTGISLFIIAIEAYVICNNLEKPGLGVFLAIIFFVIAVTVLSESKKYSD